MSSYSFEFRLTSLFSRLLLVLCLPIIVNAVARCDVAGGPATRSDSNQDQPQEGLQLVCRVSPVVVDVGNPVILDVYLKNVTGINRSFPVSDSERDFTFHVLNSKGVSVPFTKYGALEQGETLDREERRYLVYLPPKEMAHFRFHLESLFDLTEKDTYTVFVTFRIPNAKREGLDRFIADTDIKSRKVAFQVKDHGPIDPDIEPLD